VRKSPLTLLCLGLAACGGGGSGGDDAAATADAFCGTHANPGILKVTNLTPAAGAIVNNQAIDHGFTVVNAPAQFNNFDFKYGPSHTAGLPSPEKPRFQLTPAGSDVIYRLTIDSWAHPGHVEVLASGGYETLAGCSWSFPSPLFSYDVVGAPDGGATSEAGGGVDSAPSPIDSSLIPVFHLDAPLQFDSAESEAAGQPEGGQATDVDGGTLDTALVLDSPRPPIDGPVDAPASPLEAGIDR
jgi:hypothetical protein